MLTAALLSLSPPSLSVTPEADCSYASFETNTPLKSYDSLINNVLRVFRPRRFVLTMMADQAAVLEMESNKQRLPFERAHVAVPGLGAYSRASSSTTIFEKDYRCFMGTWLREQGAGGAGAQRKAAELKPGLAGGRRAGLERYPYRPRGVSFG